jgi:tyrosyl-tRNA synthetase
VSAHDRRSDEAVAGQVAEQKRKLLRGAVQVISEADLDSKLARSIRTGRPLRVKLGVDPTSSQLHLGFTVVLNKLRAFQDCGHLAVLIVGDATALVGDPTGRNQTRPRLTREEVDANAASYLEQAGRVLDLPRVELRRNSEWLGKLGFHGMIDLLAKTTVARMLERDDFKGRWDRKTPIFLHEMLYPLLQGRDSVEVAADVELGGTDQLFNLLVGRDLQVDAGMEPQVCLTMPILPGLDGVQKMSKSYGNTIALLDPPDEMFGKVMSVPDALLREYLTLTTALPEPEIERLLAGHPRDAKVALGRALVARYHGEDAASLAADRFRRVFSEKQTPEAMPDFVVKPDPAGDGAVGIVDLVVAAGFAKSRSEARRLVEQGGVSVDGAKVADIAARVRISGGEVLRVGKLSFARLRRE